MKSRSLARARLESDSKLEDRQARRQLSAGLGKASGSQGVQRHQSPCEGPPRETDYGGQEEEQRSCKEEDDIGQHVDSQGLRNDQRPRRGGLNHDRNDS
ncbi:hypothetical protein GCM10027427_04550 [Pseudoclavibacter terrae]